MDKDVMIEKLSKLPPSWVDFLERKVLDKLPSVQKEIEKQTNDMMADIETNLRPYDGRYDKFTEFPKEGVSREKITTWMKEMMEEETKRWNGGFCSGTVYHGYPEHIDFMNEIYSITSQTNPLHSDLFPSIAKFEAEIISMTANMLGAKNCSDNVCGSETSGGSESIMMATEVFEGTITDLYLPKKKKK